MFENEWAGAESGDRVRQRNKKLACGTDPSHNTAGRLDALATSRHVARIPLDQLDLSQRTFGCSGFTQRRNEIHDNL